MPRNTKIQLRRGSGSPNPADFLVGEPAWDSASGKLYVKNASGAMVEINGTGGSGGSSYTIGATPPSSASSGDKWYDIDNGLEYTYINDGDSSAWVETGTPAALPNKLVYDVDVASNAEIDVSKLKNGLARQLVQTASNGTDVEWTSSVALPESLSASSLTATGGNISVDGAFSVVFRDLSSSGSISVRAQNKLSASSAYILPSQPPHAGTTGLLQSNDSGGLSWVESTGISLIQADVLSTPGTTTWTTPTNAKLLVVQAIGGGGGGASGGASANTAYGGTGGGSAGATVRAVLDATSVGPSVSVTVGAAGVGGAAKTFTAAGSNGGVVGESGTGGGDTKFGNFILAEGGNGGIVNTSATAVGGGGAAVAILAGYTIPIEIGGEGGNGAATDNNPTTGAGPSSTFGMSSGGGAGGGVGVAATAVAATAGGAAGSLAGGTAGTSSTVNGNATAGGNGSSATYGYQASGGGGGGNCSTSTGNATAGAGGNGGGYGAGGGGGGAARVATTSGNVATSGKGGNGGTGLLVIQTYG